MAVVFLSASVRWGSGKAASPDPSPRRDGTVRGLVRFVGAVPAGTTLPMSSDPRCREQHPRGFKYRPFEVDPEGGLSDAFVYVKKGTEGRKFPLPAERVVLDQKGCWYAPRVAGAMVGQTVEIRNSDPTMHNVNALPEFNAAMPPSVRAIEKRFSKPEIMRSLKCNVHPWMTAYIGVVDNPYYAVTKKDGRFEIKGLPPGKYVLEAWHEKLGVVARDVAVAAEGAEVDLTFAAGQGLRRPAVKVAPRAGASVETKPGETR